MSFPVIFLLFVWKSGDSCIIFADSFPSIEKRHQNRAASIQESSWLKLKSSRLSQAIEPPQFLNFYQRIANTFLNPRESLVR